MRRKDYRQSSGQVLMISLWVLAILVIFSISVSYRMMVEVRLARFHRDKLKAYYLARGYLLKLIEHEKNSYMPDVYVCRESPYNWIEAPEHKSTDTKVAYRIIDERGKFNLNEMDVDNNPGRGYLINLLVNIPNKINSSAEAEILVDNLADWIDQDDNSRLGGSQFEKDNYSGYPLRDGDIGDLSELQLINSWDEEILYGDKNSNVGIIDFLTIYTKDAAININTCPMDIIAAVSNDVTTSAIIDFRNAGNELGEVPDRCFVGSGVPIVTVGDIKSAIGKDLIEQVIELNSPNVPADINLTSADWQSLSSIFTTSSDILRFEVEADVGGIKQRIATIADFSTGKILYWQEE